MCRPMKNFDILIVGGGVVGSACAYYLKKHGFSGSIGIVEKDTSYQDGCTARSAGGIRQQFSTPENIELSKFGLALIRNLKAEFGPEAEVNFREQGYLILASEDGLPILEENHRTQIAHGADNAILNGDDLSARFPWLVVDGIAAGCFGLSANEACLSGVEIALIVGILLVYLRTSDKSELKKYVHFGLASSLRSAAAFPQAFVTK